MTFRLGGFGLFPYYPQYPIQPYFQPYIPYYQPYIQPYYQPCNPMIPMAMGPSFYPSYPMPHRILLPLIESEML